MRNLVIFSSNLEVVRTCVVVWHNIRRTDWFLKDGLWAVRKVRLAT